MTSRAAAELFSREPVCVDLDTPLETAWQVMQQRHVRHLPVVEGGKLHGILSDRDLLMRATRRLDGELELPDLCAAEAMSFNPVSCSAHTPIDRIAGEMLRHHIDAMPIVSEDGHLLGIVTSTDLLRLIAERRLA